MAARLQPLPSVTNSGFFSVGALSGTWVLLVTDDPHGRTLYREILEHCGALVTAVEDPEAALDVMRRAKPDVIVASCHQVGRDSSRLIREVRALKPEEGGVVPAIELLGYGERGTDGGYEARLTIPFDSWALCQMISNLVTVS